MIVPGTKGSGHDKKRADSSGKQDRKDRALHDDRVEEPNFRCGYVTTVTVAEPFDRYLSRLADRNKRSVPC